VTAPDLAAPQPRTLVPSGLLGIAIFVAAEAMFFAGLISAYWVLRTQAMGWPPFDQPRLPVVVTGVNTGVLFLSGLAMHRALRTATGRRPHLTRWLVAAALLGTLFLAVQGFEWIRLIGFGLTTASSLYGATFYTLVGAHALHVVAALAVLLWVTALALRRPEGPDETALRVCHVYWLFVVGVWPVIYGLVYLA
jgi:cytochrome c oxidase subunit 3